MNTPRFNLLCSALAVMMFFVSVSGVFAADYDTYMLSGKRSLGASNFPEAESSFREALKLRPSSTEALLYLGITLSHTRPDEAFSVLNRALLLDPKNPRINLELGKLYVNRDVPSEAMDYLETVKEFSPGSAEALRAEEIISDIQKENQLAERPWDLELTAGGQYDTNVLLLADDAPPPKGTDDEEDYRAILTLKGTYKFSQTQQGHTSAGYEFYQSLHQDLVDYDVNSHTLNLKFASLIRSYTLDLRYKYNTITLGGEDFSSSHILTPSLVIPWEKDVFTIINYRWLYNDAVDGDLFPTNSSKTGNYHQFGIIHELSLGRQSKLQAGLSYDTSRTKEDSRDYNGYKGFFNFTLRLPYSFSGVLFSEYYTRDFGGPEPQREEKKYTGSVSLKANLNKQSVLTINYTYIRNNADPEIYDYKRSISGLFLTVRL